MGSRSSPNRLTVSPKPPPPDRPGRHQNLAIALRKAMERRLTKAGYEVATYPSALHLLVNLPTESIPSCILLDMRIPGLDGPALQKRLGELGSKLPIIFLTGYRDIPATVQAIKAGADDFLTKPVASDDLLAAVAKA